MHRKGVGSDGPERLAGVEFFSGLSEAHRRILARLVDELSAEPGETLMEQGTFGYEAIFIEQGTVDVLNDGQRINTAGPGEIVGELALVETEGRRTATVLVTTPLRALSLTSHSIREIQSGIPDLAEAIDRAAAEHRERDRLRRDGRIAAG
ncbi:MAG TPA: cyclic nucleotide-binding domain-containing protein [Solirubrobacteraceae bacterium]|jgi:CRP-like cAMP-binding protein